jgi:hypothetical protein
MLYRQRSLVFTVILSSRVYHKTEQWSQSAVFRELSSGIVTTVVPTAHRCVCVLFYALLGYYAAYGGNSLPTFPDNLSVPSSGVKKSGVLGL